jgi:Protein of unknown function (DUF1493)
MPSFDEIAAFVCDHAGANRAYVTEGTSLQDDIGLYGDDIDHLMLEYSKRFGVDLSGYLWYFHTGEDGFGIGALLFRPPDMRVKRIPITVGMLHDFANQGRWAVEYPMHELPRWRMDVTIDVLLAIVFIGFIVFSCIAGICNSWLGQ